MMQVLQRLFCSTCIIFVLIFLSMHIVKQKHCRSETIMVNDKAAPVWRHQIKLIDREELTVDGVSSLGSYDEKEVVMETAQGTMIVNGEGLNVKQLNLEASNIIIEGNIKGIQYEEGHKERRGILDRFLK